MIVLGRCSRLVSCWLVSNDLWQPDRTAEIVMAMPQALANYGEEKAIYEYLRALFPQEIEALGDQAFMG